MPLSFQVNAATAACYDVILCMLLEMWQGCYAAYLPEASVAVYLAGSGGQKMLKACTFTEVC